MNIKDYAKIVLDLNDKAKTAQAIAKLENGLKWEEKWNDQHRAEVRKLVAFLKSGDTDIDNLDKYN